MAIFKSERDKILLLVIIAAVASVYAFYTFRWTPVNETLQASQEHVDSLDFALFHQSMNASKEQVKSSMGHILRRISPPRRSDRVCNTGTEILKPLAGKRLRNPRSFRHHGIVAIQNIDISARTFGVLHDRFNGSL